MTDTRILRGDERDGEREVVPVSTRELELATLIEAQALELADEFESEARAEFSYEDIEAGETITLLDPIKAEEREMARWRAAGPRYRVTAYDLDQRGA